MLKLSFKNMAFLILNKKIAFWVVADVDNNEDGGSNESNSTVFDFKAVIIFTVDIVVLL